LRSWHRETNNVIHNMQMVWHPTTMSKNTI